jgi:hypothetical protein
MSSFLKVMKVEDSGFELEEYFKHPKRDQKYSS